MDFGVAAVVAWRFRSGRGRRYLSGRSPILAPEALGQLSKHHEREERCLANHEEKLLLVDRDQLAFGLRTRRGAARCLVHEGQLAEKAIGPQHFDDATIPHDLDLATLDDVHEVGRLT